MTTDMTMVGSHKTYAYNATAKQTQKTDQNADAFFNRFIRETEAKKHYENNQTAPLPRQTKHSAPRGDVLTLHGECEEGERRVTAWADNITGTSMSVYTPKGYDPKNPVYKVKVWDKSGNITEHMVDISKVNPRDCSTIEMYAYSAYLSSTGQCPDALTKFMMAQAHEGQNSYDALFEKKDWLSVVRSLMNTQYRAGNLDGYLGYKIFYEALERAEREHRST